MQQSSTSHPRHLPSASCAFVWHSTKMSVRRSMTSQTIAEKNHMEMKAPMYCPAPTGCIKNAFTYSSKITAFRYQNKDKHHLYRQGKHRKAECFYHVINRSMPSKEGILLPLKGQVPEKLTKG